MKMSERGKRTVLGPLQHDIFLETIPDEYLKPLSELNGDAEQLLTQVLGHERIAARIEKHRRKINKSSDLSEVTESITNEFRGMSTEYLSYLQTRELLGDMMVVLSPANVDQIYSATQRDRKGPKYFPAKPDGLLLQQRGYQTFLVGACEYTCSPNTTKGRQSSRYYGNVYDFVYAKRSEDFQDMLGYEINRLHPQLPPHLVYSKNDFEVLLTRPQDADQTSLYPNRHVLPLPLQSEEITQMARDLINSLAN